MGQHAKLIGIRYETGRDLCNPGRDNHSGMGFSGHEDRYWLDLAAFHRAERLVAASCKGALRSELVLGHLMK